MFYIEDKIKRFDWPLLRNMYGCANSTIIGFLASQWLAASEEHSILDGAPSPEIGMGRAGHVNADILLCRGDEPLLVAEVETNVDSYLGKLDTLYSYIENDDEFEGLQTGLLFMNNLCSGPRKYRHNWEEAKRRARESRANTILVSVEKQKARFERKSSVLGKLRKRNDYYPWDIVRIDYWSYSSTGRTNRANLWEREEPGGLS